MIMSLIWGQISLSHEMYFWCKAARKLLNESLDPEQPDLNAEPIHPFYLALKILSS